MLGKELRPTRAPALDEKNGKLDYRNAVKPREQATTSVASTLATVLSELQRPLVPTLSEPPATSSHKQPSQTAPTSSEHAGASATSAPPSREQWGLTAATAPNGLPQLYDTSLDGLPSRPLQTERRDVDDGHGGGDPRMGSSDESMAQPRTWVGPSQPPPPPPRYTSTTNTILSQPRLSIPNSDVLHSPQWCDSPGLSGLRRHAAYHQQGTLPTGMSGASGDAMSGGVNFSLDGRSSFTSPMDRAAPPPSLQPPLPPLPPLQSAQLPPAPDRRALDVPSTKLQAIINEFLCQRFWELGGTERATYLLEPQRHVLQELMYHHFFQEETAQRRQSRLLEATDPAVLALPSPSLGPVTSPTPTVATTPNNTDAVVVPSVAHAHELERELQRRYRHQRFTKAVQWELILPFWRGSPPLTVEAVSPLARRRAEQWRWQSLVLDAALSYTPAILEAPPSHADHDNATGDADPFVSDPLVRLNGRARECPPLPMTRRTTWNPHRTASPPTEEPAATANAILQRKQREARALDGTCFMACLRQSLLIDQGVRAHRVLRAEGAEWRPLIFPFPFLPDGARNLHTALLTDDSAAVLSRIHVDALSAKGLAALTGAGPQASPSQTWLVSGDGGPLTATAVLTDALAPASPPSHSLRPSLTGDGGGGSLSASLSALFTGRVSVYNNSVTSGAREDAEGGGGAAAERRHENPSTEFLSWAQWASTLRHPLLANPSRALLVEDVTGTCHILCGRPSPPPSMATLSWLRHRHAARQAPLMFPVRPVLTGPVAAGEVADVDAATESGVDEGEDYVLCPLPPRPAPSFHSHSHSLSATNTTSIDDDRWDATSTTGDYDDECDERCDDDGGANCDNEGGEEEEEEAAQSVSETDIEEYRFGLMMEEWNAKRERVVHRMNCTDPPWRMIGSRLGAEPRPLALHLTDAQLPWLAQQLCPDHDGLLDLQELHLAFGYDTLFRHDNMHAWLWSKGILSTRKNLLVLRLHFALEPGAVGTGVDTDDDETNSLPGDAAGGPTGSVLVGGIALPARTVARVSARVSARSLSSASSTTGVGAFQQHSSHPPSLPPPPPPSTFSDPATTTATRHAQTGTPAVGTAQSAPSLPIPVAQDGAVSGSISQVVSPMLRPRDADAGAVTPQPMVGLASDLVAPLSPQQPAVVTSQSATAHVSPMPPPPLSPPPRTVMHQPQPQPRPTGLLCDDEREPGAPITHIYHQPRRPGAASPTTVDIDLGTSASTASEVLRRLSQRPAVGVCSTVPQPEEDPAVLREVMLRGLEFVPSLQVLHIQNGPIEVLRSLFRETRQQHHHYYYGNMGSSRYASLLPPPPKAGLNPEMVSPLREIYFSAEQPPRTRHEAVLLEVTVHRFPLLEVLWVDAPRVHYVFFTPLTATTSLAAPTIPTMPLRELHLLLDASFSSSNLAGIETVPTLEVVHLERIIVNTVGFLGKSRSLRELLLHSCRFIPFTAGDESNGSHPLLGVETAPCLETLSLAYTNDAKTIDNFARCRSLRKIILTRCNGISSASLVGLEALPLLSELCLEYTRVSNLSVFAKTPSLRVLRLLGCKRVLRMSILDLERSPTLTELYLNDTNVVTVANLGCGSSLIKVLDLSGCRHLDDSGVQGLQGLSHLEVLNLSHTPVTRVEFLRDCPSLATLYLERCTRLTADGLRGLEHLPRLQRLVVTGCPGVEVVGFLGGSSSLLALSLAGCAALTSDGLLGLERCATLRYLHVADTAVSSVSFLAGGARQLQYLNVSGCAQLTSSGLHGLERLPALLHLYLERLSSSVNDISFLIVSRSLRRISLRDSTGVSVYARRELARGKGITIEH